MIELYLVSVVVSMVSIKVCMPLIKESFHRNADIKAYVLVLLIVACVPIINSVLAVFGAVATLVKILFLNTWFKGKSVLDFFVGSKKK